MWSLLSKLKNDKRGAIAVETAIIAPLVAVILLNALDVAMRVKTMQNMSNSTKNAVQYVVNGGRSEQTIRTIMQTSFGQQISNNQITINGYCACIVENDTSNQEDSDTTQPAGPEAYYVKMSTPVSTDMCQASSCDSSSAVTGLIEIKFDHTLNGSLKDYQITQALQTRIQ